MNDQNPIKIAAIQDSPVFLQKEATIEKACGLIKKAAAEGASLALFPEAFISGYPDWVWTVPPLGKWLRQKRRDTVEPSFADAKHLHGLRYARYR